MIVELFYIKLRSITLADIEMIRQWRNSEIVRNNMLYQEILTAQQQIQWFESIDNPFNFYFIIEAENKAIGVANLKDIDTQNKMAEPGIFFHDSAFSNGIYPLNTALILTELAFYFLGLNSLHSKVIKHNLAAYKFNINIGFKEIETPNPNFFSFILWPQYYAPQQALIRKSLSILHHAAAQEKLKINMAASYLHTIQQFYTINFALLNIEIEDE